jgi:alpha-tubulin suppressor-like RCC1 family protein
MVFGPVRDEEDVSNAEPTQIGSDTDWDLVSVGDQHVCGVKTDGTLWCFGSNERGQLGLGSTYVSEPTSVAIP